MRFRHPDGSVVHLAYCTNVHPAEDVDGILAQLRLFAAQVRRRLEVPRLGIGLWISAEAAAGLVRDPGELERLRAELDTHRLEVVTLNGFPYSSFHAPVVKRRVYRPDWTDPARLAYTVDLARLLAALLPEDAEEGTISTLPLGWRAPWGDEELTRARAQLTRLAGSLAELEEETGRRIRIGLEPEPGCVVETTEQASALLFDLEPEWIGVCLDACHLAVQFEEPEDAIAALAAAGVPIVKAQVSSALRVSSPRSRASAARLAAFAEPRFLHQTRERRGGVVAGVDDLGEAMAGGLPGDGRVAGALPRPGARQRRRDDAAGAGGDAGRARGRRDAAHTPSRDRDVHLDRPARGQPPGPRRRARRRAGPRGRVDARPAPRARADRGGRVSRKLLVLDVVGLTPKLLRHMPRLSALAGDGFQAELGTVLPAVTCSVQSTFLTGLPPAGHGIVGNGWYFRDLGEVFLWRQHNALVQGEKLWEAARRAEPGLRTANLCWWYAMGASTDLTLTPRPVYHADGRKSPDCYTVPASLREELQAELGPFPLFQYWGPTASIASSEWIGKAAERVLAREQPELTLVYLPHLDYDLQRFGPESAQAYEAARAIDAVAGRLVDAARAREVEVVVLSEYGITPAARPVDVNRLLRREGLLEVFTQEGMEYLDPWTSRAFAVADHQVAHVYVREPELAAGGRRPARRRCRASTSCSTRTGSARPGSTTRAPASSSPSPSRTPGSPTTTGSTTSALPTSRAPSRSTASRATTRPSSSSTRPTRA